jgi:hypothetical protein
VPRVVAKKRAKRRYRMLSFDGANLCFLGVLTRGHSRLRNRVTRRGYGCSRHTEVWGPRPERIRPWGRTLLGISIRGDTHLSRRIVERPVAARRQGLYRPCPGLYP